MIAVVGLGNLGLAIALRLVERGHRVIGIDIDPERRKTCLTMAQLVPVESLDEVDWEQVTAVFVVVRLASQALDVLEQLASYRSNESLVAYVTTTLDRSSASKLRSLNTSSLRIVELPVSGGEAAARGGTLTVLAAGPLGADDEQFLRNTISQTFVRFDAYGEPTLAKLLNNALTAYNALAFSYVILLGEREGVSPKLLQQVITKSSGSSWILGVYLDFPADLLTKDVELLHNALGKLPPINLETTGTNSLEAVIGKGRRALTHEPPSPE